MSQSLLEQIRADQLVARKARDTVIADLLGTVLGECETRAKNIRPTRALTDGEVLLAIQRTVRSLGETYTLIKDTPDRADQALRLRKERAYLERYLPQPLTDQELEEIAIRLNAIMDMKHIMENLRREYAGRYDPQRAAEIVRMVTRT